MIKRTPLQNKIFNWKQKLERKGFRLMELAHKAGISSSYLYRLMNGESTNPSKEFMDEVEGAFRELTK